MAGRPKGSENKDKPFRDALRLELAAAGDDGKKLRSIARALIAKAEEGELQAIQQIADRLDGKPAQESTVTIDDKRDATDWTRDELVAFLRDSAADRMGASEAEGRGREPDSVH
jgi:hypothetical protein